MKKLLLAASVVFVCLAARAAEKKPNVILILIDDFGYECVAADGGESYKTPVMDRLADGGIRFDQCHVQPLCTPTRVEVMTGLYNRRNYTRFGHLDPSQTTFGNLFKSAGYATCIAGKWQLANGFDGPTHFGFDEYCLWQLTRDGARRTSRYKNPGIEIGGKVVEYKSGEYGPDIVGDFVTDFVTRKKDVPFFVYYPMMLTHDPYDATPDSADYAAYKSGTGGKKKAYGHFADMVAYTDKLIGKLVARLDELHLSDNTMILVLGDNGTKRGTPARFKGRDVAGGKGTTTEWGTHVPLIGYWPGRFPAGRTSSDLIDATDILPTLCDAANIPAPRTLDGRSFLPRLTGKDFRPREWLYSWYNPEGGATAKAEFVHDSHYKLYADGRFFDVEKDDGEKNPIPERALAPDARAARTRFAEALKSFQSPREEYFAKQGRPFGGEAGEDAEGNKKTKEPK